MRHLNLIGNAWICSWTLALLYGNMMWGIEAKEERGEVRTTPRQYWSPDDPQQSRSVGSWIHRLEWRRRDFFWTGSGRQGAQDRTHPRLAIARVVKLSGAADIILEWEGPRWWWRFISSLYFLPRVLRYGGCQTSSFWKSGGWIVVLSETLQFQPISSRCGRLVCRMNAEDVVLGLQICLPFSGHSVVWFWTRGRSLCRTCNRF